MFSVDAGNAQSSCLVVGVVANCSTHAGLPHSSFDRWNCCASVGRSMHVLTAAERRGRRSASVTSRTLIKHTIKKNLKIHWGSLMAQSATMRRSMKPAL